MNPVIDDIERGASEGHERIAAASDLDGLHQAETDVLGKKAPLTLLKKQLGSLDDDGRRAAGQALNAARASLEAEIADRRRQLEAEARSLRLEAERLDLTFQTVNAIVNGRRNITPNTALRLARVFGTSPAFWLNLQQTWDLYREMHSEEAKEIAKLKPIAVAHA